MERLESLQFEHYRIYQDEALGCFSEDSILLHRFAVPKRGQRVLDLGTGNGILAILGDAVYKCRYVGIDINEAQLALARKSAALNGQEIDFLLLNCKAAPDFFGHGSFECVVCNPPYFQKGNVSQNSSIALARHQSHAEFSDFLRSAFLLLKNGGTFYMCYPVHDLCTLLCLLRENRLEPKVLCFPRNDFVLIECKKLGKNGLRIVNP
ncbi:MAG: methyltransferase domain-containing protein [Clostridia bacterium]|nr:methyltransferase domain-containing protein [Clostridia bacterium]